MAKPKTNHSVRVIGGVFLLAGATALGASACNKRVFEVVDDVCGATLAEDVPVPLEKAADILIVVDNSGSMAEEQQNLARNFFDPACPLTDLANIPEQFKNPNNAQIEQLASQCGFIQLLAAFENDFRVGVITTDVGECDNRLPEAQGNANGEPDWGFRPQRGCLQPNGPPGTVSKVIARADLLDDDPSNDDIGGRFVDTLNNIKIFGTPFERGLDAMRIFLDGNARRAEGCEDDLNSFLRDNTKLVVIFLTDEEDCSHDDAGEFGNEFEGETCGRFLEHFGRGADRCYAATDQLSDVEDYSDFLKSLRGDDASVAVIAGGVRNDAGGVVPGGCVVGGNGEPDGACEPTQGNSNTAVCNGQPCCTGDAGNRYFELASQMGAGKALTDSICFDEFRKTMIDIARFIARVDFVELAEAPADRNAIVVTISEEGGDPVTIEPLPEGADCATTTGWQLEGDRRVNFCGDAVPGPGETVQVRAKGNTDEQCL